jgi:carboxyl-terminal processing protease
MVYHPIDLMKPNMNSKTYYLSFLILLFSLSASGQNNYKKIEIFTKIWGFLKYHHPTVAAGSINWDSVYVNNLSKINMNSSNAAFNECILSIINNLGPIEKTEVTTFTDTLFNKNHNLKWLKTNRIISFTVKAKLNEIYIYRSQGENKYIKMANLTADYSGESKYESMGFPSEEYRLLFLARFWNAINYFAPYKYEIGEDWDNILSRFIPKMVNAKDTVKYYKSLLQLSVSMGDGHSQLTLADNNDKINDLVFGKYTAPIYTDIAEGKIIVRKVANDSLNQINIRRGDIIFSVDNEPAAKRMKRISEYISASNKVTKDKYLTWSFFNTPNDYQRLEIKRGRQIIIVKVKCIMASKRDWGDLTNYTSNETGYKTVGNSIAYVYAWQMWKGNMDTIKELIKSKKAVIFDVRNYPGSDYFYNIFDVFLPESKAINQSLCISINNPGYFRWQLSPKIGSTNKSPYSGKVVILTDERSQSQGEYSVMCFQTIPNSVTVGSQTAGADGVVTTIPMGGKLSLSYSGYGIFYPDKTPTQRRGVKIDIEAMKTAEGITQNRDVALEKALEFLKNRGID